MKPTYEAAQSGPPSQEGLVSVIVLNWNASALLLAALASVPVSVAPFPHEITVVDNASTDGSAELAAARWPAVRLIRNNSNEGYGRACDVGVRASRGEIVAVMNPDVELAPGSLARLVEVLRDAPTRGLAGPRVVGSDGALQKSVIVRPSPATAFLGMPIVAGMWKVLRSRSRGLRQCFSVAGCCMVFRRAALDACGGFPSGSFMYGEEIIIGERLRRAGYSVWHEPAAEVVHHGGVSSAQRWSSGEQGWRARVGMTAAAKAILTPLSFGLWNALQVINAAMRSLAWVSADLERSRLYLRRAVLHLSELRATLWGSHPE